MVNLGRLHKGNPMQEMNRRLVHKANMAPHCVLDGSVTEKVGTWGVMTFYFCGECGAMIASATDTESILYLSPGEWD